MDPRRELATPVVTGLLALLVLTVLTLGVIAFIGIPGDSPGQEQIAAEPPAAPANYQGAQDEPFDEPLADEPRTTTRQTNADPAGTADDIYADRTTNQYGQPLDAPARTAGEEQAPMTNQGALNGGMQEQQPQQQQQNPQQGVLPDEQALAEEEWPVADQQDSDEQIPQDQLTQDQLTDEELAALQDEAALAEEELTEEQFREQLNRSPAGVAPQEEELAQEELDDEGDMPEEQVLADEDAIADALHDTTRADINAQQQDTLAAADDEIRELVQRMTRQDLAVMDMMQRYIDEAILDVQNWADDRFATEDRVDDLEEDVRQLEEAVYGTGVGEGMVAGDTDVLAEEEFIEEELAEEEFFEDEGFFEEELAAEERSSRMGSTLRSDSTYRTAKGGHTVYRHGDATCFLTTRYHDGRSLQQWRCYS